MAVLLASSITVYAQRDKDKHSSPPPSHQSAPSHQSPPARHEAPSQPTQHSAQPSGQPQHQSPQGGQITRGNPGGGSPNGGGHQPGGGVQSQTIHPSQPTPQATPSGNQPTRNPNGNPNGGSGRQFGNGQPPSQPNANSGGNNSGRQFGNGSRPGGNAPQSNPGGFNRNNGGQPGGQSGSMGANNRFGNNGGRTAPQVVHTAGGGEIHRSASGTVREVRTPNGAIIHHAPGGVRSVEVARPGGRVIVATGRSGYVQRPLIVNNRTYIQRTYVVHGVSYARVYRPYSWGGLSFHIYTPVHYYHPGFYAYVYNPWARPVYYSWGWGGSPWYGYYGGWFTPYPVYSSPALWLTDYLIARTLEDAYQARMDAAAAAAQQQNNYAATPLTPDVKQAISDEVRRQMDQERAEQQNQGGGSPALFGGGTSHVFVVANALSVNSPDGECSVTEGDVLQMNGAPQPNSTYADVVVLASKGRDCRKGARVSVALVDLQEMQNQMRATLDLGLNDLQSKQGQGGLPQLPPGTAGTENAPFAGQVQPDANASAELSQASQEADRAEQDVLSQANVSNAGGPPPTVSLGMTINEVEQMMGRPQSVANVGSKRIYVYNGLKITFIDGKVSDVQ